MRWIHKIHTAILVIALFLLIGIFAAAGHNASGTPSDCPCTIWPSSGLPDQPSSAKDGSGLELGVILHSDQNGYLKAVRFYKSLLSTDSTHTVHVWSGTGTLLATAQSVTETDYGWQEVPLPSGVPVTAGQNYVVSYYSASGTYIYSVNTLAADAGSGLLHANASGSRFKSGTSGFPNNSTATTAKYSYGLDTIFTATDSYTAPFSVGVSEPAANAYGVLPGAPLKFTMTSPVDASTVTGAVTLKDSNNSTVAGTVAYDSTHQAITFTPTQPLTAGGSYTAQLAGTIANIYSTTLGSNYSLNFTVGSVLQSTTTNPGGPILIVTSAGNPYSGYLAEMLRAEGMNYYDSKDVGQLSTATLQNYKVVLLGNTSLTAGQVSDLQAWVQAGGDLIAMRPDKQLASLLGLTDQSQTLVNGYVQVDTSAAPGQGIAAETMQYHTTADLYTTASGTQTLATLFNDASTTASRPAVTQRTVGSGQAAAFMYDLPKSIAQTHQGNPAWAGQDRDGSTPIRPNDLFNGNGSTDWLNVAKAHIPQADEQQRLLANMITNMSHATNPLPKFWYLPHGYKTALVMVEDDHGSANGTADVFDQLLNTNPNYCSVTDWTCARGGSLLYTISGLTPTKALWFSQNGFSMGVHVNTNCSNFSSYANLGAMYDQDITAFAAKYTGLPAQKADRTHCYVWSDWDSVAKQDAARGMRYNLNYEWFPPAWTASNTGYLTGSGMNMRFTDATGNLIDAYQGVTDLDYETDLTSTTINTDLDNAQNSNEYYGVFGTHFDYTNTYHRQLMASAQTRNVPMVSPDQMLAWKDAQGSSSFQNITSDAHNLAFTVRVAQGGQGMQAMIPATASQALTSLKRNGADVTYSLATTKGIEYAVFNAIPGTYAAAYGTNPDPGHDDDGDGDGTPVDSGDGGTTTPSNGSPGTSTTTKKPVDTGTTTPTTTDISTEDPNSIVSPEPIAGNNGNTEAQSKQPQTNPDEAAHQSTLRTVSTIATVGVSLILAAIATIFFIRKRRTHNQMGQDGQERPPLA